ncbi:Response regulator of zinc sigma-54-dependent two-component system [Minicystis rosea]|nr:Response regulator of zinc sigma-54-dependent two-component system [Minicystis rosea]
MSQEGPKLEGSARVLVVDDEPVVRRTLARALMGRGIAVDTAEGGAAALDLLRTRAVDAVLLDHAMPDMDGLSVLARVRHEHPEIEVVMMVLAGDPGAAEHALRGGAYDVVVKPIDAPDAVARSVERAAERRRLEGRVRALTQRLAAQEPLGEIIIASARMEEIDRRVSSAASTSSPVLIMGERGTGKELFARAIHRRSNRSDARLHVLRLAGLPEALASTELIGAIEDAEGGTLLLDDIGEMGPAAQAALARAIGTGELHAGSAAARRFDVRLVATALPSLRDRIKEGTFREDLFYRLGVIPIEIPPLRRHKDDIPVLAYHFLSRYAPRAGKEIRRIGVEALRRLREHTWPGNVRELAAVIEHAVVMAKGDAILPADLPIAEPDDASDHDDDDDAPPRTAIADAEVLELPYADAKDRAVEVFDRAYVGRLMKRAGGNVSEAARLAGMDRSNFRRLLKRTQEKDEVAKKK